MVLIYIFLISGDMLFFLMIVGHLGYFLVYFQFIDFAHFLWRVIWFFSLQITLKMQLQKQHLPFLFETKHLITDELIH